MKLKSYFERVKKPVKTPKEAEPIVKETKTYLFISLGIAVPFGILSGLFSGILNIVFTLFALVGIAGAIVFGIYLYVIKRVLKRLENMTCECGNTFVLDDVVVWKEVSRRWVDTSNNNKAESKLYVTINITCKCPVCGKEKSFTETLCSGKISVSNASVKDTLVSVESLIVDYFNGLIHA